MDNTILENFRLSMQASLMQAYGFCGVADAAEFCMLNSSDKNGNDIIIKIQVKKP